MQIIRIVCEPMNIVSLQTFLAIVETGSLVRASHKMNVTQSTVTARLKTLEDELGQQLLIRQKSGTTLTPAGTKLLRYARTMVGLWRQARFETGLPAGLNSVCTFGCHSGLWHGPGKAFFDGVIQRSPEMAVSVQQGHQSDLDSWLEQGMVDVIVTYDTALRGQQTAYALPPEDLRLYSDDPATPIRNSQSYIFVDYGADYRRQHDEAYHDAGIARVNFDSADWGLEFLLEHGGSAYLPRALAAPYLASAQLHVLDSAPHFQRKRNLVVNDTAAKNWLWFSPLVAHLQTHLSQSDAS